MNDVIQRMASIQARFSVAAPKATAVTGKTSSAAVAKASTTGATTADDFSSILADARRTVTAMSAATGASTTGGLGVSGAADASTTAALRDAIARMNGTTANTTVPDIYAEHRDQIAQIATEEGVPASLLGALVWSESGFDQNATSSAGARGLTQLMPATADGLGVDIDDPTDNLRGGARYLRSMLDRFGRTDLALAAYNAGPNAVTKYGGVPPYQETQTYVTRVLARATTLAGGTP